MRPPCEVPRVPETIACPACGAANALPQGRAPFFCSACNAIVDPNRAATASRGAGSPDASSLAARIASGAATPTGYTSRYGTAMPRDLAGPGGAASVGGSLAVGLLLAAAGGVGIAAVLGWLGEHFVKAPVVMPLVVGWGIRRMLALGGGGGTPDRGVVGTIVLLAIVATAFGTLRWMEYRGIVDRESKVVQDAFDLSASSAVGDSSLALDNLRRKDSDGDGSVTLPGGRTVSIEAEKERLRNARATGLVPRDGYDLEMLAATGSQGFSGHFGHTVREGLDLRMIASGGAIHVPGFAAAILWLFEAVVLLVAAFLRVE